uniref:Putative secreted protein n=1 Tax=Anopheles marajoara TaxID=58244 RepID=A0A2M4CA44_9DIPT
MRRSSSVYARSSLVASFCPSSNLASCTSTSSVGLEPAVAASRLWQIFHLSSISLMNGSRSVSIIAPRIPSRASVFSSLFSSPSRMPVM